METGVTLISELAIQKATDSCFKWQKKWEGHVNKAIFIHLWVISLWLLLSRTYLKLRCVMRPTKLCKAQHKGEAKSGVIPWPLSQGLKHQEALKGYVLREDLLKHEACSESGRIGTVWNPLGLVLQATR